MKHEQTRMAYCEGLGVISSCSCGLYHIHLRGVSIHLDEEAFERLVEMLKEAKENVDLYRSQGSDPEGSHLLLVKH